MCSKSSVPCFTKFIVLPQRSESRDERSLNKHMGVFKVFSTCSNKFDIPQVAIDFIFKLLINAVVRDESCDWYRWLVFVV